MRTLKQRLRAGLAEMAVGAVAATSALILVLLPPPAAATTDCWVDAEHAVTGDERPVTGTAAAVARPSPSHSTVTLFARFRGLSTSVPRAHAV